MKEEGREKKIERRKRKRIFYLPSLSMHFLRVRYGHDLRSRTKLSLVRNKDPSKYQVNRTILYKGAVRETRR